MMHGGRRELSRRRPCATTAQQRQPRPRRRLLRRPVAHKHEDGVYSAETLRDLSKISEVNQKDIRQQTPAEKMLNTAVSEVARNLRVTRALAVVGTPEAAGNGAEFARLA